MGYIRIAVLVLGVLAVSGCGDGGGNRAPRGTVCGRGINPLPVELNEKNEAKKPQKISLVPDVAGGISDYPGTYLYDGAEFFYRNKTSEVQMHFSDSRDPKSKEKEKEDQFKVNIVCVSGLKPAMPPISFSKTALSDLEVLIVNGRTGMDFGVRNFTISFDKSKFPERKAEKGDPTQFESPSKVYEGQAEIYHFYKNAADNQVDFQTRSHYVLSDHEELDIVVKYKRTLPQAGFRN